MSRLIGLYLLWESLEKLGKIKMQPYLNFRKKTDGIEGGLKVGESRDGIVNMKAVLMF